MKLLKDKDTEKEVTEREKLVQDTVKSRKKNRLLNKSQKSNRVTRKQDRRTRRERKRNNKETL